jgi:hypothetical protein
MGKSKGKAKGKGQIGPGCKGVGCQMGAGGDCKCG